MFETGKSLSLNKIPVLFLRKYFNLHCIKQNEKHPYQIQILEYITHATAKEIHLKFTHDPSNLASNHYDSILLLEEPTLRNTNEEVTVESPCPRTIEQPICLDDVDVIDLTDDSEITTSKQPEVVMSCNSLCTYLLTQKLNV